MTSVQHILASRISKPLGGASYLEIPQRFGFVSQDERRNLPANPPDHGDAGGNFGMIAPASIGRVCRSSELHGRSMD